MEIFKICFKCNIRKPLSEYHVHKKMWDGHLNKCKICASRDVRENRRNSPRAREYDRRRYYENPERRLFTLMNTLKWQNENPEAYKCHYTTHNAIRDGKIIRQPCRICGNKKSHAHHWDYSKPFDIDWLCAVHHSAEHHEDFDMMNDTNPIGAAKR